jgi:hypothetical protein
MDVSGSVYTLPANLPVPVDDGAADHLRGAAFPPDRNAEVVLTWLRDGGAR